MDRATAPLPPAVAIAGPDPAGPRAFGFLRAWRERLYAERCCRRLRRLHDRLGAADPGLRGVALYSRVVQHHLGCDEGTAARVLGSAAESFADWPQARALTFRDVVHYIAAIGLCQAPGGPGWVGSDLRPIIRRRVPAHW